MRRNAFIALLSLALLIVTSNVLAETIAVRFGRLITQQGPPVADAVVLIENKEITRVGHEIAIPAGARIIDLRPLTGVPGLIDVHTHMTFYWDRSPGSRAWTQLGTLSTAMTVFLAQENARRTLESGVTTVRDLGALDGADYAMRDLIQRGAMTGPRMFVAGCPLHVTSEPLRPGHVTPDRCRADGMDEVMHVARQQLADGADWIKLFGSTGSGEDVAGLQTYSYEEMRAAVEVAHRAGKRVAVHSYGPEGARDAVKAGADSIEHAVDIDDATFAEMVRRGTVYVPTIDHNRYYIEHKDEFGYDAEAVARLQSLIARNVETLHRAIKSRVKIAMGSDAVFTAFGENTRELEWFVKAGMTATQALQCATTVGAGLLGKSGELGIAAPGALADLAAVEGDPLQDIGVMRNVKWVMKDGNVVVDRR